MFRFISQQAQIVRSYYSGIGKEKVLYPASFGVSLALGLVVLGIVFYGRDVLHLSPSVVGQLACVHTMTYTAGCLLLQPLLRRIPSQYLIIGSNLLMGLSMFALVHAPSAAWAFAFCGCFGLAMSLFWPRAMGWLSSEKEGAELGKVMSRFNISWSAAAIVSPYLCGRLLEISRLLPLKLAGVVFFLVAAFVTGASAVLPRIRNDPSQTQQADDATGKDQSTFLRFPAWIALFATYFGGGVLSSIFPMAARDMLEIPERNIGLLLLVANLANVLGFVLLGRTQFWHFKLYPMIASLAARGVLFAAMMFAASIAPIGVLMLFFGLTASMIYNASIFHGASGSVDRARRMAVHEALIAGGFVAGSVIGGISYEHWSIRSTYGIAVAIIILAIGVQWFVVKKLARQHPSMETGSFAGPQ